MAMACGFRVKSLSVERIGGNAGRVVWETPVEPTSDDRRRIIFIFAAGMAADYVRLKRIKSSEDRSIEGHHGDRFDALHHQIALGEDDAFDYYLIVAKDFFEREDVWKFVELIAETALITGGIDGEMLLCQLQASCPKLPDDQLARPGVINRLDKMSGDNERSS